MHGNKSSRKYQLTINNPLEKGMTHEKIKTRLKNLKSTVYFCMSDEIGSESGTPHTHVFVLFSSPVRWSTLQNAFDKKVHIEIARGTSQENRDYIGKFGKWENSEKHGTSVENSFEEDGICPDEKQGQRHDLALFYDLIKAGLSDIELLEIEPSYLRYLGYADRIRNSLAKDTVKTEFRNLKITYIWGKTGVGKTKYVMEKFGYENIFRCTDYSHPFDNYAGQDVICFDEYSDGFKIREALLYWDGYPLELPCRYSNKWAKFTQVYIISNHPLSEQYKYEQIYDTEVWHALLRRITEIYEFLPDGQKILYQVNKDFEIVPVLPDETASNPFEIETRKQN